MTKEFKDLHGNPYTVEFTEHDISKYEYLLHVTDKTRRKDIEEFGLLVGQPLNRSIVETGMLFFSYPIDKNTSDCFRWDDGRCSLIVIDVQKLIEAKYVFYDDYWGRKDQSSKRNHIITNRDIPREFIKSILEW